MNREQYAKLTDEEKRIKIAELCDWTNIIVLKPNVYRGIVIKGRPPYLKDRPELHGEDTIPDYLNDLNACHEFETYAELGMSEHSGKAAEYSALLRHIAVEGGRHLFSATAEQRCEAFVLTMEGADD